MKQLFILLIVLAIVAIAVFSGSWIFDFIATVFNLIAKGFQWLSKIFNWFGWNKGMLGG